MIVDELVTVDYGAEEEWVATVGGAMLEREGLVDCEARLATGVVNLRRWNLLWSAFGPRH